MTKLTKILAAAVIGVIFFVAPSSGAATALAHEKFCATKIICKLETDKAARNYLDFWSKFRDTVMPDKPQDNNPPKEYRPRPAPPAHRAPPPRRTHPKPAN